MNDVGGSESGRGLRAVKSSRTSDSNFEYDDSEWDVGIGNLIIDLDADIEKTNEAATRSGGSSNSSSGSTPVTVQQNLSRSTPPSSSATNSQMHIPQSPATTSTTTANNSTKGKSSTSVTASGNSVVLPSTPTNPTGKLGSSPGSSSESFVSTNSVISVSMEHATMSDKGLKMKIKRSKPGTKSVEARHEIVKSDVLAHAAAPTNTSSSTSLMKGQLTNDTKSTFSLSSSQKDGKETKDKDFSQDSSGGQDSSKAKAAKRPTSTHKKVKLASGYTAAIVSTKKDVAGPAESKSSTNPTNTLNTSLGNSHGKDNFGSSTNSSPLSNIGSAFAKTSTSSHIKLPNQGNILGNDLTSTTNTSAAGSTTNCRSLHNNSTSSHNNTAAQLTASSPSKSTDKTGTSVLNQSLDKGVASSPSYGKKARVTAVNNSEKNSSHEATPPTAQNLSSTGSGGTIGFPTLSYRNITNVGSEPVTTSSSGGTNFATTNISTTVGQTAKDSSSSTATMNNRVPVQQPISFQDACVGTTVGTVTEPDCLGPCEPGTSVTLEGIVWHETESGVLVVNVTWRGKTYVGTLLDCTKSDWASPRFCDSPTSDLEMRTPKNRGKRGRAQTATPVSDPGIVDATKSSSAKLRNGAKGRRGATNAAFVAPVSPLKPDQWQKRKTRGSETESQEESTSTSKSTKRLKLNKETSGRQTGSPAPSGTGETLGPYSPALIECPEPNCSKKYKHINGLRYHQSHAHSNNFAAEDSDSNMSTASNTNLNSVTESAGLPIDDVPIEARIDVDAIEASGAESNSAPTTPVKKQITKPSDVEDKDKVDDVVVDLDMKVDDEKTPSPSKLTMGTPSEKEKEDTEKGVEKNDSPGSKERELPSTGLSSRTPILTVPTLPFMSLQNRNQLHSLHRTGNPEGPDKSNRDQDPTVMGKIGTNSSNTSSVPASKGISWQPHAISPFHAQQQQQQQNLNIPVTLNVPMGSSITSSRDHDKGSKDSRTGSTTPGSPSKKSKHKKKSKDKSSDKERERDREGKSKLSSSYMSRDNTIKPGLFSPTAIQRDKERGFKGQDFSPQRDPECGGSHAGENPQSPAYSDISDANDSGPESDMNLDGKEQGAKSTTGDLKKDGSSGQNLSSFYSPFYTPMDSPYLSSANPPCQVKSERNPGGGGGGGSGTGPPDDQGADKFKSKSSTSLPQHISAHMDDRRSSPKLDYHHPKYLPPQQHYYPYGYPNYHFDQGYPGLMPENSYSHNRSIIEEKERETEEQRVRLNSKGRIPSECVKEEPGLPTNLSSVKQDPDRDRGDSHRSAILEDKSPSHPPEQKSNFPGDYQESKRHGASGMSSYGHSTPSKHSKESRREREERHGKDAEGKDAGKSSLRGSEQSRHKNIDRERESNNEKESKNEGAKPTMETQGPPPPPTAGSYAYYPPSYLQGAPYSLPFDPNHMFRQMVVPSPYPGSPYMHPHAGNIPRFSQPAAPASLPEDLSRPNPAAPPAKALDILQHHAAQYYASHKIHELQERALKSPSPQINANRENSGSNISGPTNLSSTSASPNPSSGRGNLTSGTSATERKQPTDLTKEVKPSINPLSSSGAGTESSRSPPSVHHVHTHMHSHTHIGYPIIPTVPPQYSPNLSHYGVLTTPAAAPPASVIPPFTSQKPS